MASAQTYGLFGSGDNGVYGSGNTAGVHGTGTIYGVYGSGTTYGVYGTGIYYGMSGYSIDGEGIYGLSGTGYGVHGSSGYIGVYGDGPFGVYGTSEQYGVFGTSNNSLCGNFYSSNGYGIRAGTTNGFYAGVFDGSVYTFGGYYSSSDKNLKKNIQDFGDAMSIINKLKPKNYEFRNDDKFATLNLPKGTHFGLIAQEVEEVLPNLVKESPQEIGSKADEIIKPKIIEGKAPDVANNQKIIKPELSKKEIMNTKGVNYEELIPIIIKGMQEQDTKIEALTQLVKQLQGSSSNLGSQDNAAVNAASLSNAALDQNVPNPLTNNTSIRYTIPAGSKAQLNITDNNGNTVKQILLTSTGKGVVNIEASTLSAGTYSYTLIVNGKKN